MIQDHPAHLNPKQRERVRVNEQKRLEHACAVLEELVGKHMSDMTQAHALHELHVLKMQLELFIKNQHIKDADYAKYKLSKALPMEGF